MFEHVRRHAIDDVCTAAVGGAGSRSRVASDRSRNVVSSAPLCASISTLERPKSCRASSRATSSESQGLPVAGAGSWTGPPPGGNQLYPAFPITASGIPVRSSTICAPRAYKSARSTWASNSRTANSMCFTSTAAAKLMFQRDMRKLSPSFSPRGTRCRPRQAKTGAAVVPVTKATAWPRPRSSRASAARG